MTIKKMIVMKELKTIDYKLLFELMKDSHRSDRQLAKALGVSQPTVTRRRAMLEENYIEGYTVVPKFFEIGFEISAITFLKTSLKKQKGKELEVTLSTLKDWYMKQSGVVLAMEGMGLGWDSACFSFHENFTSLTSFLRSLESELSDLIIESQTFIINFKTDAVLKPFHLKYLTMPKK